MNTLFSKIILLSLIVLGFQNTTYAQLLTEAQGIVEETVDAETIKLPKMVFDKKTVAFGKIKKGEKREATFEFTNVGNAPLEIDLISVCECTEKTYKDKVYHPGDKGQIHIVFDSAEKDKTDSSSDIDIFLKNTDPETGGPIIEMLNFTFEIIE